MKKTILLPATLALTAMMLSGCGQKHSEENTPGTPAPTNSADERPMPEAVVSNNVTAPPAASPVPTNTPDTNNPAVTNQ